MWIERGFGWRDVITWHLLIIFEERPCYGLLPSVLAIALLIFLDPSFYHYFLLALTNPITCRITSDGQAITSVITVTSIVPPGSVITPDTIPKNHESKTNIGAIVGGVVGGTLYVFFP